MSNRYTYQDPRRQAFSEEVKELIAFQRQLSDNIKRLLTRQAEYAEQLKNGCHPTQLDYAMLLYAKNVALVSYVDQEFANRIAMLEASAHRMTQYLARYGKKFQGVNKELWQLDVLGAYETIAGAKESLAAGRRRVNITPQLRAELKNIMQRALALAPSAAQSATFPFGAGLVL
ncbi:MAG: hypothetical protein P4L53_09380 [Candidatus Obscuribacterales bacterium]|nr:hypothetical protein [Candidatus Obscuribacterales bacterium]